MHTEVKKLKTVYEQYIHERGKYPKRVLMSRSQYEIFSKVLQYLDMKEFHGCKEVVTDSVKDGEYIFN